MSTITSSTHKNIPWEPRPAWEVNVAWRSQRKLCATQEEKLRSPEDIAGVGFDDIPPAATSKPRLMIVRQPIQRTGSPATEMLSDLTEHPGPQPRHGGLPIELPSVHPVERACLIKGGDILPKIQI